MLVDAFDEGATVTHPATNSRPSPEELRTLIAVAQSLERANEWHEAERAWREVLKVAEDFWLPYLALAQIYKTVGRHDDLMKALELAEKMVPDDDVAAKARLSELAGGWAAAIERWQLTILVSPDVWHHYISLARSYEQLSDIPRCIEVLWKAEVKFFDEIDIVSELAQVAQRHGRWAEAERCWRKYMAARPQDSFVVRHLAFVARQNRASISPDFKESDLFAYKTFDDAREQIQDVVRYHELSAPVLPELSQPAFYYGASEEIIDKGINHLKYFVGTGVYELRNAQIFRERLVRCGGFILHGYQMESYEHVIRHKLDDELLLPIRDLKTRTVARPVVSLQIGAYPVYGHWLVDVMPQIYALIELGFRLNDLQFVLPDLLPSYYREFFSYCDVDESQILIHDHNREMLNCALLIVPTHMNNTRTFTPSFRKGAEWFRNNIERQHGRLRDESRPKRLFVARQDQTSGRPLINRGEIIELARERGFHIMLPETLPLIEQWRYYASADIVVGEYGSALHSSIVCDPGTIMCCLRGTALGPGYLQSGIGEALSQPTGYIFGQTDESSGLPCYAIDPELFQECVDSLLLKWDV